MTEIRRFGRLGSAQAEALRAAREGARTGTTIVAETQDSGRGRLDHSWASPPGGLYLSRIEADPGGAVELLPMAIANGLAEWMYRAYDVPTAVRWPNDLWVADPPGKIAGVLSERVATSSGPRLVIGIGVNLAPRRSDFPAALRTEVAILQERTSREVSGPGAEAAVLRAIRFGLEALAAPDGRSRIVAEVSARLDGVGRLAALDGIEVGRIVGMDDSGGLVTEVHGDLRTHLAGSLRLVTEPVSEIGTPRRRHRERG